MTIQKTLSLLIQLFLIVGGAILSSLAVIVFLVPAQIAPGGVSGIAVILHELIEFPIGIMILIGNIPIQYLGYRILGGSRALISTIAVIAIYSLGIDLLTPYFPAEGVSDDSLLNAIYGGVLGGIGTAMIYRAGATAGGTTTLARILQHRFGLPLTSAYLYTDALVMILAGVVFGWEAAMLAIISLVVGGIASDYVLEGPSVIRTVTIITDHPEEIAAVILKEMGRGVTAWRGTGMYTHQEHTILFVTISRQQVTILRELVISADPQAFIVIEQGHIAYGAGFKSTRATVSLDSPE